MNKYKVAFILMLTTSLVAFLSACDSERDLKQESEVANKILNLTNKNLNLGGGIITGVDFEKTNFKGTIHLIAEDKKENTPYFVKYSFKHTGNLTYQNLLNSVTTNINNLDYTIETSKTTYEVLNILTQINSENSSNFGYINSIMYTQNDSGLYSVELNCNVNTENTNYTVTNTLLTPVTNLSDINDYVEYTLNKINDGSFNNAFNTSVNENLFNEELKAVENSEDENTQETSTYLNVEYFQNDNINLQDDISM